MPWVTSARHGIRPHSKSPLVNSELEVGEHVVPLVLIVVVVVLVVLVVVEVIALVVNVPVGPQEQAELYLPGVAPQPPVN